MSGPIRRLRAATKIPSPRATVQSVVANDPEHQVGAVRLVFLGGDGPSPVTKTLDLQPAGFDRKSGDAYFGGKVGFEDCPVNASYDVELTMIDANGKEMDKPGVFTLTVDSYDELIVLTDSDIDGVKDRQMIRRSVGLLRNVLATDEG